MAKRGQGEADPDRALVRRGWWFVSGAGIVLSLAIVWAPIAALGIDRVFWTGSRNLWIEVAALIAAAIANFVWIRWSRSRWRKWAYPRAADLDRLKVIAMLEGVIRRDKAFLEQVASQPEHDT